MEELDYGGPAFPVSTKDYTKACQDSPHTEQFAGMTLRDYFAAKALQGELAAQSEKSGFYGKPNYLNLAIASYRIADVMLVARKEKCP